MNTKLEDVIKHIKDLARYKEGWYDGDIGTPATIQTLHSAVTFATQLELDGMWIPIPFISLANDGEISFWWDLDNLKLGVDILEDGTYAYYGKSNTNQYSGDNIDIHTALPTDLIKELLFAQYTLR